MQVSQHIQLCTGHGQMCLPVPQQTLLQSIFEHQGRSVTLTLSNGLIILREDLIEDSTLQLNLQTKFSIIHAQQGNFRTSPIGFTLHLNVNPLWSFRHQDRQVVEKWIDALQAQIYQLDRDKYFRNDQILGKGSFGSVYRVKRTVDGALYVMKAFPKKLSKDLEKKHIEVRRQILNLKNARHQNILHGYTAFESENTIYVLMDYIEGYTLASLLSFNSKKEILEPEANQYNFNEEDLKTLLKGLLQGLNYLHERGVVHQDLKPQNIMLRRDSLFPVIIDLGFATQVDSQYDVYSLSGTHGFIAPENFELPRPHNWRLTTKSDIFSLGVVLYYTLFKTYPWQGNKQGDLKKANQQRIVYIDPQKLKNISPLLADLLKKLLQVDPCCRISAEDALKHKFFSESCKGKALRKTKPISKSRRNQRK